MDIKKVTLRPSNDGSLWRVEVNYDREEAAYVEVNPAPGLAPRPRATYSFEYIDKMCDEWRHLNGDWNGWRPFFEAIGARTITVDTN